MGLLTTLLAGVFAVGLKPVAAVLAPVVTGAASGIATAANWIAPVAWPVTKAAGFAADCATGVASWATETAMPTVASPPGMAATAVAYPCKTSFVTGLGKDVFDNYINK